jgi:hypothetical protein
MTRDEVRFLLGRLGAAYDRRPPTPDAVDEWERALRPYTATDAHAALDRLIDTGQPSPKLATFVAHVRAQLPPEPLQLFAAPPPAPWPGPTQRGRDLIAHAKAVLRHPSTQEPE